MRLEPWRVTWWVRGPFGGLMPARREEGLTLALEEYRP